MTTCGMYDYAGEWVYRVGLPAKSGVAGGILAVLPGQLAIGVFSPPLDERGNSVRGVAVCEALSEELGLHFLRAPRAAISAVRSRSTLQGLGSKRAAASPSGVGSPPSGTKPPSTSCRAISPSPASRPWCGESSASLPRSPASCSTSRA